MWTNLGAKGTQPKPRSGHSLTFVDRSTYIMYGGIEEPKEIKADTKIVPNGDIYSMKLSQSKSKVPHSLSPWSLNFKWIETVSALYF